MTVVGLLANALILSGGVLSFWLLDREVRPQAHRRRSKTRQDDAPAPRPDAAANDSEPLDQPPSEDRGQTVPVWLGSRPFRDPIPHAAGSS